MSQARVEVAGTEVSTEHYIGGRRVGSETTFEDRSPIDWSWQLATVARGDADTAAAAVGAAQAAFPVWAEHTVAERAAVLHRLADRIDANVERIAEVECLDMGMLERSLKARV
ncbi:MAG: aldehyde dehydrogenase family protein, partial [Actinomycetota bacterium]